MAHETARRSFLTRLSVAAAAFGLGGSTASAAAPPDGPFQPAKHAEDDWLDERAGKHRLFLDCLQPAGVSEGTAFAMNFIEGNKSGYGLEPADLSVVLCLRHSATLYAYNDAIWAKHGALFADTLKLTAAQPPSANPRMAGLTNLVSRGVRFAVCDMATHRFAAMVARRTNAGADETYKDFAANLIPNARLVTAGIIAVNRAQERGYTFAFAG